jgi:hypothetical protein
MPRKRSARTISTDKAYREAHRKEAGARARAWAKANPEKRRETERRYRAANRAKITEQKRVWRTNNPDKHNAANQRWKINRRMKLCDFDAMLAAQGGGCAICKITHAARKRSGRLSIDHCHTTGRVRGLLCHRCNSLLGHAKDNVETLRRAIAYLEVSRGDNSGGPLR